MLQKQTKFALYKELFARNVELVFLKEPHINTATYKQVMDNRINITMDSGDKATDDLMKNMIEALMRYHSQSHRVVCG